MTARGGYVIERGASWAAPHVLSFTSYEAFVNAYSGKVWQDMETVARDKLLKSVYVYCLMNPCLIDDYGKAEVLRDSLHSHEGGCHRHC
jgi:hypothetical protein